MGKLGNIIKKVSNPLEHLKAAKKIVKATDPIGGRLLGGGGNKVGAGPMMGPGATGQVQPSFAAQNPMLNPGIMMGNNPAMMAQGAPSPEAAMQPMPDQGGYAGMPPDPSGGMPMPDPAAGMQAQLPDQGGYVGMPDDASGQSKNRMVAALQRLRTKGRGWMLAHGNTLEQ